MEGITDRTEGKTVRGPYKKSVLLNVGGKDFFVGIGEDIIDRMTSAGEMLYRINNELQSSEEYEPKSVAAQFSKVFDTLLCEGATEKVFGTKTPEPVELSKTLLCVMRKYREIIDTAFGNKV